MAQLKNTLITGDARVTGTLYANNINGNTSQGTTYVSSLTHSAINFNWNATFGGWMSGPTKNGRITIATYPGNNDMLYFGYGEDGRSTNSYAESMTWDAATGQLKATTVKNAIWNDYAEYRKTIKNIEAGRVVIDQDNGTMILAERRLLPSAQIISDTWGHIMGETDEAKTPIAVAGRVLVYPYRDRKEYHAGQAVCSAPNGTVDIMTREEIKEYPDCIIGYVSEIPDYEVWGSGNVQVNNRIWVRVK